MKRGMTMVVMTDPSREHVMSMGRSIHNFQVISRTTPIRIPSKELSYVRSKDRSRLEYLLFEQNLRPLTFSSGLSGDRHNLHCEPSLR
jgi:hypothetical protein